MWLAVPWSTAAPEAKFESVTGNMSSVPWVPSMNPAPEMVAFGVAGMNEKHETCVITRRAPPGTAPKTAAQSPANWQLANAVSWYGCRPGSSWFTVLTGAAIVTGTLAPGLSVTGLTTVTGVGFSARAIPGNTAAQIKASARSAPPAFVFMDAPWAWRPRDRGQPPP